MPAGRPPFYNSVEELQKAIDDYFESLKPKEIQMPGNESESMAPTPNIFIPSKPATITGLCLHLGFSSRQALLNYEEKPEFNDAIKRAKLRIEMEYEEALRGKNAAGPIFALKNFGWTDKQEIDQKTEHSGGITIKFEEPDLQHPENKSSS